MSPRKKSIPAPESPPPAPTSLDLATALARAVVDKKGDEVALLDMAPLVDFADVFLLATAQNRRHAMALADEVRRVAREQFGLHATGREGYTAARWILVDFGGVIVHVFDGPMRAFYHLDGLWADAVRLPVPSPTADAPAS